MLGSWISLSDVGREFHSRGAVIAKARLPNVLVTNAWLGLVHAAPVAQINISHYFHILPGMSAAAGLLSFSDQDTTK